MRWACIGWLYGGGVVCGAMTSASFCPTVHPLASANTVTVVPHRTVHIMLLDMFGADGHTSRGLHHAALLRADGHTFGAPCVQTHFWGPLQGCTTSSSSSPYNGFDIVFDPFSRLDSHHAAPHTSRAALFPFSSLSGLVCRVLIGACNPMS